MTDAGDILAAYAFGAIGVFVHVVVVMLGLNLLKNIGPVLVHAASALIVHGASVAVAVASEATIPYWHSAALYWCGVAGFLFLFGAIYKSLSLRMLCLIAGRPERAASVGALTEEVIRPSFADRIALLEKQGLVRREVDGYTVTAAGRTLAARIRRVQALLGIEASGLYSR